MAAATVLRRSPRSTGSPGWVFLPLTVAFLIIAGIAIYGAISPYNAKKPPPPGSRGSLVWGDGIFANRAQLKAWLRLHGASYESWAKTHPRALFLVRPRPVHHRTVLAKPSKKTTVHKAAAKPPVTHKPVTHKPIAHKPHPATKVASKPVVPIAPTAVLASGTSERRVGVWLVVAFGLMFGLMAATPARLLRRAGVHLGSRESEMRLAAVGAGAALLLGVIAATVLG